MTTLFDVSVLVSAHRPAANAHEPCREWLNQSLSSPAAFGYSELVLSGFVRIVTHPKIFRTPTPLVDALGEAARIRQRPNAVRMDPGARHWDIFTKLCVDSRAKGPLIADAYHAALAIEHGAEWVTTDRDFSRFPGLRSHLL